MSALRPEPYLARAVVSPPPLSPPLGWAAATNGVAITDSARAAEASSRRSIMGPSCSSGVDDYTRAENTIGPGGPVSGVAGACLVFVPRVKQPWSRARRWAGCFRSLGLGALGADPEPVVAELVLPVLAIKLPHEVFVVNDDRFFLVV